MDYFISDLHFGHKKTIEYDNRPFKTIEEHDQTLIANWNKTVTDDDTVYLLGDISWMRPQATENLFYELAGNICLIVGNHDNRLLRHTRLRNRFSEICDYKELDSVNETKLVLCHYPIPCFKNHTRGWSHFYGHVHNSYEYEMMKKLRNDMVAKYGMPHNFINVGCMMPYMNYTPRTFEEIIKN